MGIIITFQLLETFCFFIAKRLNTAQSFEMGPKSLLNPSIPRMSHESWFYNSTQMRTDVTSKELRAQGVSAAELKRADFTAIDLKAGGFCLMELKDNKGDEVCKITTTQDRRGVCWHTNFVARLEGPLYSDRRCLPSSHYAGSCCKDKFCPHPKPNLGGRMNPFLTCKKSMPHVFPYFLFICFF